MENDTWLQIRIDPKVKDKFKALASNNGVDMSGMIRLLIIREINHSQHIDTLSAVDTPLRKRG
jgi:antitoxin component of RelBE/YafQ-DinJ toxin-antitoxin module